MFFRKKKLEQRVKEIFENEENWMDTILMSAKESEEGKNIAKNFLNNLKAYRASNDIKSMRELMYGMGYEFALSSQLTDDETIIKKADLVIEEFEKIL